MDFFFHLILFNLNIKFNSVFLKKHSKNKVMLTLNFIFSFSKLTWQSDGSEEEDDQNDVRKSGCEINNSSTTFDSFD